MYTLITVLLFIVCILLILIVLVQNSKGGGLASNFQSSNQIMGVRKTTDFLEKATWVLAGTLLVYQLVLLHSSHANQKTVPNQRLKIRFKMLLILIRFQVFLHQHLLLRLRHQLLLLLSKKTSFRLNLNML